MTAGSDIWLNNPIRPMEASGTSGMKAALNGTPIVLFLTDGGLKLAFMEKMDGR